MNLTDIKQEMFMEDTLRATRTFRAIGQQGFDGFVP